MYPRSLLRPVSTAPAVSDPARAAVREHTLRVLSEVTDRLGLEFDADAVRAMNAPERLR